MSKTKGEAERRQDSEKKLEYALAHLSQAIQDRMRFKTWGTVTLTFVVEAGFVKELVIDDKTVLREFPSAAIAKTEKPVDTLSA